MDNSYLKFIKDGEIRYLGQIVVYHEDGSYTCNITRETAIANGWEECLNPSVEAAVAFTHETVKSSVTLSDDDALHLVVYLADWEDFIGERLPEGIVVRYGGSPWRVRQDIPEVLENQNPGIDTAALYERIDREHAGTQDDPIPYAPPMEIFSGKYYTQGGVLYRCTRDSGTALTHDLAELAGHYAEIIKPEGDAAVGAE